VSAPLRVGIVGCGNVALNFHVPAYRAVADRYTVVRLADPTPERLELGRATAGLSAEQVHLDAAAQAQRRGVRVAIEMHANQLVYSVPGLLKLRGAVGDTVGANLDPSHLLWMGADPIAAIGALTGAIHHVHAKDTRIEDRVAINSRLETIPNERTDQRAWNYVAVGTGHRDGVAFWTRFVDAVRAAGYTGPLSVENEDYALGQRESVALAVETLRHALSAPPTGGLAR
jgi:sugar phosphate isomerase/epimerase